MKYIDWLSIGSIVQARNRTHSSENHVDSLKHLEILCLHSCGFSLGAFELRLASRERKSSRNVEKGIESETDNETDQRRMF